MDTGQPLPDLRRAGRPHAARFTAAHVGDGSARLARLRPGTRVLVEGPYGRLHGGVRSHREVLLMGSGIGITPLRALLEELDQAPGDVTVVHRVHDRRDAVLVGEIDAVAAARGARYLIVEGPRVRDRHSWLPDQAGHLTDAEALLQLAPDLADHDVYLCGSDRALRGRPAGRLAYDPTGLVKGWAVAGAAAHLDVVPEVAYSIGAGGDVVVGAGPGPSAAAPAWRIGIEDPRHRGSVAEVVTIRRGAVATSGAAARGAHVEDPLTGEGIAREGSATVVGPDPLWADVWATAAWVDPHRARALLAERDPAYRLITL